MVELFVKRRDAARILGVKDTHVDHLSPYLLRFFVTRPKTQLFSRSYIEGYRDYLRESGQPVTVTTARSFASTDQAIQLVEKAWAAFEKRLKGKKEHTVREAAELLCVSRMTITDWYRAGFLTPTPQTVDPQRYGGRGQREILLFPQSEIRRLGEWQLP